jgi:tetratricopeptide (TPR) repeat protein
MRSTTAENARTWYATGVGWIEKEAVNLGITYLERAIPAFEELGDTLRATRARHHRLLGLQRSDRHEEVETEMPEVLAGYRRLNSAYGHALALAHLAGSIAQLGRWERAMTHLNLAEAIAATRSERTVLRYVLERQAELHLQRESFAQALRLLKRAETSAAEDALEVEVARHRAAQGTALARMGERSQAVGVLEDARTRFMNLGRNREALEVLALLSRIYESTGQFEEQARVKELMHQCGQKVLRGPEERRRRRAPGEPPVDPEALGAESAG